LAMKRGNVITRDEHLALCKQRALAYCDRGDALNAITSMLSDMEKHPETISPALTQMTLRLMIIGALGTVDAMRKHIEGFR
jgi:hypothetical protein